MPLVVCCSLTLGQRWWKFVLKKMIFFILHFCLKKLIILEILNLVGEGED